MLYVLMLEQQKTLNCNELAPRLEEDKVCRQCFECISGIMAVSHIVQVIIRWAGGGGGGTRMQSVKLVS